MKRLPISTQSLIIQCVAWLLIVLLHDLLSPQLSTQFALWQLAMTQGVVAALLSGMVRQPIWWLPLHFGFSPAIVLAQQANLPAWGYLGAFVLLVLFYWNTFRTRVPLYLSDSKAWQAVTPLLPQQQIFSFIDLGSGLGDVPFYLESRFPQGRFFGTEIAPGPWLISRFRAWLKKSRVVFMRRNYAGLDLANFDVIFAFLSPAAMPALWQQAQSQMRHGGLFISLSFTVYSRQPDHVLPFAAGKRHTLYAWKM